MIKFDRSIECGEIKLAKEVLEKEKLKNSGTYNKKEVLDALMIVFSGKCYICENKKITSYNIEHLKPHRDSNIDLKFDWENLFLACGHCNNIKSDKFDNILNCSIVDVDEKISFRKFGNFSWNEKVEILPLEEDEEVLKTVELLNKVYNGTTEIKTLECKNIIRELRYSLNEFTDVINEYCESTGEAKEDARLLIHKHLRVPSPFAAFKRWIIKDNKEILNDILIKGK
ncbi:HNH endonuclease [Clostridium massiliamazoniense]|uniref:HNH endonuclease n=1 Tax=Clostridium massiliamazoniense TaxID=1347366 RepID=UPI0006D81D3E|nr:HNH endonuclease [Clostridium massiliamazoniense]